MPLGALTDIEHARGSSPRLTARVAAESQAMRLGGGGAGEEDGAAGGAARGGDRPVVAADGRIVLESNARRCHLAFRAGPRVDLARAGRFGPLSSAGFVPAVIVPEVAVTSGSLTAEGRGRIEIMTANEQRVIVDRDVDVEALLRIVQALERLA